MSVVMVVAGGVLLVLQGVSIVLHLVHADALAALDDKVVDALKKLGVSPPAGQ